MGMWGVERRDSGEERRAPEKTCGGAGAGRAICGQGEAQRRAHAPVRPHLLNQAAQAPGVDRMWRRLRDRGPVPPRHLGRPADGRSGAVPMAERGPRVAPRLLLRGCVHQPQLPVPLGRHEHGPRAHGAVHHAAVPHQEPRRRKHRPQAHGRVLLELETGQRQGTQSGQERLHRLRRHPHDVNVPSHAALLRLPRLPEGHQRRVTQRLGPMNCSPRHLQRRVVTGGGLHSPQRRRGPVLAARRSMQAPHADVRAVGLELRGAGNERFSHNAEGVPRRRSALQGPLWVRIRCACVLALYGKLAVTEDTSDVTDCVNLANMAVAFAQGSWKQRW